MNQKNSQKIENQAIEMIDPDTEYRITEKVQMETSYLGGKIVNKSRKANFTFAVKNTKTFEIGFVEIDEEIFNNLKSDYPVTVYTFKNTTSKGVKVYEGKKYLRTYLRNVKTFADICKK